VVFPTGTIINQTGELLVKVTNHDRDNAEEVNVELQLGDQRRPAGRISLDPGATIVDTISFTINQRGWQKATVSITDYPFNLTTTTTSVFTCATTLGF
jgi:hypothetical protein